jgi:TolB protein
MDSDGANREELATLNVLSGQTVSWSPDGSTVAAISTTYDIYAVPLDGSAPTNLTNTPSPASEGQPAWSPLGNKIVYLNANKLWTMNADGSGKQELTPSGSRPTWAPDGASVVYQAVQDGYDEVMTVTLDGGEPMALTDDGPNTYPSWSPDGEFVGYIQSQGSSPVVKYVVTMRPNGTGKETFSVSGNVDNLSWSPCLE